ncbi:uncharacterized protein BP5553_08969 [Venustampulla echinocandica]|uniref:RNA polymerase II-associated protein RBA50 n=1 Tax=Venustampulla echinocandica TaxID=2656787 RepID=A0A370TDH0_9HELO|nr:uncharacterized protein BP5553_08969 [Venustampulla echinocandica]RDL32513.1 hypothetical protein BP5553_08969 [Venustampulla echinocandica]
MDLRGQRFVVDLSDDEQADESPSASRIPSNIPPSLLPGFIGDIKERDPAPPSPPKLKSTSTGFPEHKKRTRVSAFKQQRGAPANPPAPDTHNASPQTTPAPLPSSGRARPVDPSFDESERRQIDEDNKERLAAMTAEEIEDERRDLFSALDPSLLKRFLARADLDGGRGDTGIDLPSTALDINNDHRVQAQPEGGVGDLPTPKLVGKQVGASKSVRFNDEKEDPEPVGLQPATDMERGVPAPKPAGKKVDAPKSVAFEDDQEPAEPIPYTDTKIHFPNAPSAPDLDPADPSFLENLHHKYFPSLPADPSKLAWMAPIPTQGSVADQESPYYPGQDAVTASALRFDFRGGLLPPRISRAVPTTKGLHHHGEAPESAGYTVPELARLARSAFPAQRCIAFQTLGRLLYRLGRGEWGDEDGEITKGLWRCAEEGKVVETLEEAASTEGGHQGSKAYATEALWLWQKGGGKRWKAS